ncbi:MAG: hypothetical protein GY723_06910 [bacterium]|nr:hypothetical protein [bacterium]MCP5065282.1 hypothetical protein [bacterium]
MHTIERRIHVKTATVLAIVAACIVACPAVALRVEGTALGTVGLGAETLGRGSDVFGLDGAGLEGQAVRIDFAYDTTAAPTPMTVVDGAGSVRSTYDTSDPSNLWLSLSVTVNHRTHALVGETRHADIIDALPIFASDTDRLQLAVAGTFRSIDGLIFRRQFLDMFLDLPADTLPGGFLPQAFDSDSVIPSGGGVVFHINEIESDSGGALLDERYVGFEIVVTEASASPVAEPNTGVLAVTGLVLLSRWSRMRCSGGRPSVPSVARSR